MVLIIFYHGIVYYQNPVVILRSEGEIGRCIYCPLLPATDTVGVPQAQEDGENTVSRRTNTIEMMIERALGIN